MYCYHKETVGNKKTLRAEFVCFTGMDIILTAYSENNIGEIDQKPTVYIEGRAVLLCTYLKWLLSIQ